MGWENGTTSAIGISMFQSMLIGNVITLLLKIILTMEQLKTNSRTLIFFIRWIQVLNATSLISSNFCAKISFGFLYPNLFLGLLFKILITLSISCLFIFSKFVFLGKYCLTNPFKFSFAPLSQL